MITQEGSSNRFEAFNSYENQKDIMALPNKVNVKENQGNWLLLRRKRPKWKQNLLMMAMLHYTKGIRKL